MKSIGIHLDSHYARVAHMNEDNNAVLVPDTSTPNSLETATEFHLSAGGIVAGELAKFLRSDEVGRSYILQLERLSGKPELESETVDCSNDVLLSLLIKKLLADVKASCHFNVGDAVIAVSRCDAEIEVAIRQAVTLAGLDSVRVIDSTTAALSWLDAPENVRTCSKIVCVIDRASFSVLLVHGNKGASMSTQHHPDLGTLQSSDALTNSIIQHIGQGVRSAGPWLRKQIEHFGGDIRDQQVAARTLINEGTAVRVVQSWPLVESILLPFSDARLASILKLLERTNTPIERVHDITIVSDHIDAFALRSSLIRLNPELDARSKVVTCRETLAHGAAVYARSHPSRQRVSSAPLELSIKLADKTGFTQLKSLLLRGSALNSVAKEILYTTRSDQVRLVIEFIDSTMPDLLRTIGIATIGPIESGRKNRPIELSIQFLSHSAIGISAKDVVSERAIDIHYKPIENTVLGVPMHIAKWIAQQRINE